MKKIFALIFACCLTFQLNSLTLAQKLQDASKGDYVVAIMSKNYSLISIHTITEKSVIFEEITVPVSCFKRGQSWEEYISLGAPKATSWILYELNLKDGKMMECYSVLEDTFLDLSSFDSMLSKLMHLDLSFVSDKNRRRIGAESVISGFDTRKIWNPPQVFEGKKCKNPQYHVYNTTWPDDDSLLAGKTVEVYFDKAKQNFPFPIWMQVKDASDASFKVPTVDGGQHLSAGYQTLPRRKPYFYDKVDIDIKKGSVIVKVNIPDYYEGLKLFFVSYLPQLGDPIFAEAKVVRAANECVEFHIPKEVVSKKLDLNRPYHFLLQIDSHPEVSAESAKSVRFKE